MTTALHRLATWNDFDRVYEIYVDPAVIPYLGFEPMSRADFRPVYQDLLASGVFHVVELEGTVDGFYKAVRQEGRSSHVVTLGAARRRAGAKGQRLRGHDARGGDLPIASRGRPAIRADGRGG
jgi:putative acetyltransferase